MGIEQPLKVTERDHYRMISTMTSVMKYNCKEKIVTYSDQQLLS